MAGEKESKGTIYQQLNKLMNLDGFGFQDNQTPMLQQSVSQQPQEKAKIVIKGNSPEEIHRKGLELEQKRELQNKFFRTTDRGFQKALQYEAARLPAYIDYEGMEYYPIISSALDLFMEEATTIGLNGKMLNIYSNKERIKYLLEEFFYDIVNVNVNLPFWVRNLPIKEDSMIPLLNGEVITIKELSERLKENPNDEIWTYSIQDKTNKTVAGKIIWCDLTRKDSEILRVRFDNNNFIETTPDHEYMMRDGSFKRADELNVNDSLMPFYTLISKGFNNIAGYEKVFDPKTNRHKFTHRIVSNQLLRGINENKNYNYVTHHVNFNKLDNSPKNLKRMTTNEHSAYHAKLGEIGKEILKRPDVVEKRMKGIDKYLRSDERKKYLSETMSGIYPNDFKKYNNSELHVKHNEIRSNNMTKLWSDVDYRTMVKDGMRLKLDDNSFNYIINIIKNNDKYIGIKSFGEKLMSDDEFMILFNNANNIINKDLSKSLSSTTLRKLIKRKTNLTYLEFYSKSNPNIIKDKNFHTATKISKSRKKEETIINHKVLSIERLNKKSDVYCMEVVGENGEQDRHNFPVCGKNDNGEYQRDGVFVSNCKYGDNFVLLYGERKKGITHVKQLVNYEIERMERIQNGKPIVKFKERMTGDEFNTFEIAHFRLLGDDKYLPYGSSVLNKIRRVFRQLVMAEDAMLTYRIIRAGEKKVFKIDVGNIDEDDIEEYIYKVATKFKKTSQVNPNDGQIDYRFNILGNDEDYFLPVRNANTQTGIETLAGACLSLDTKIELLDGRSLMLSEIINEHNLGKELWSYSINPETGNIVPGKITWAGITRKNADVVKITLDNGESIVATPDHKFPTKFNGTKEAKDLSVGESLWAFNKKKKIIKGGTGTRNTYEMVYDHSINDWVYTHRMVGNFMKEKNLHEIFTHNNEPIDSKKGTIHHKNFNRYNNPENLCFMSFKDHFYYHHDTAIDMYNTYSDETKKLHKELRKIGTTKYWNKISDEDLKLKRNVAIENSLKTRDIANETFLNNPNRDEIIRLRGLSISETKSKPENRKKQSIVVSLQCENTNLRKIIKEKQTIKYSHKLLDSLIEYCGEYNRIDLILENIINVENSEWLNEFNALNPNNNQPKKMTKITRNNIDKMLKHFGYSNWRDFKNKIPCYNHKIVSIEWLSEKQDTGTLTIDGGEQLHDYHNFALSCGVFTRNSNLDQIQDIEYLRDNLFIGLGVPKPFLSFQDAAGAGKNMAQYDIRFAKKISRIQQAMVQELNKMAMVHLYLLGYSGEDLSSFTLTLANPSTQQELLRSELMRDKAQTYTELTRAEGGIAAMSHTTAKRLIFNMSDREIVDDLKQQKMEKAVMQELQDSPITIKKTGLFTDIDKRYGEPVEGLPISSGTEGGMPPEGGAGAPPPMGGAPASAPPMGGAPAGGGDMGGAPAGGAPPMMEGRLTQEEYNKHVENLVYGSTQEPEHKNIEAQREIIQENNEINDKLNKNAQDMINEINGLLKSTESINTIQKISEAQDVEIEDIESIDLPE